MDNASTHVLAYTLQNLFVSNIKIHFNVSYTPAFNCIELCFGFIKYYVRK